MTTLSATTVARARQHSLLLATESARSVLDVATWFGAMQAQDAASGVWSLGVRVAGSTKADVDAAFERAEVIRTWPMRGTIHIVPARDARWMLALTGPRALSGTQTRRQQLDLTSNDLERAVDVLGIALAGGRLTRAATLAALQDAGLDTSSQRGYHLLWYASQVGVTCIGPMEGKEQTFVLLDQWAPDQVTMDSGDALVELALRYFRSHGPATIKDFAGWTGLTLTAARAAVAGNDGRLVSAPFEDGELWMTSELLSAIDDGATAQPLPAVALPGFDEFLLGFKDRRVQLAPENMEQVVPGSNGMFRSTICIDGRAVATWVRTARKSRIDVTLEPFAPLGSRQVTSAERALDRYADFLGLPVVCAW